MPAISASNRPGLSMQEMFEEPHREVPIHRLMDQYELEIERFTLGMYRYYTPGQLLDHYNVEVELARQLMNAPKSARTELYTSLYDTLFREVPYHPQLAKKTDPQQRREEAARSYESFRSYLRPDSTFLEIGPGDCALSVEVCRHVAKVYAVDVSTEITNNIEAPNNFELRLSDGAQIDVPSSSVDVAYSNQLMEHLHPEDALTQLKGIHAALVPGGVYICITPHRFGGPADISRFFDEQARGFHLKEYTNAELHSLFKAAGFSRVASMRRIAGRRVGVPIAIVAVLEAMIKPLSHARRRYWYFALKKFLNIRIVAWK